MKKYCRLLPYSVVACLLCLVILYLLNKTSEENVAQLRVRNSPVLDLPWERDMDGEAEASLQDTGAVYNSTPVPIIQGLMHDRKRHKVTSTIQTSRHVALEYECRSRNISHPWSSLPASVRQAVSQRVVVNDEHKMLYCAVPLLSMGPCMKVMYFITPHGEGLVDISKVPGGELGVKKNFVYLSSFSLEEQEKRIESYLSFMVSRHPFQRLAIAYKLKFEGVNPFFHDRYGKEIIKNYRKSLSNDNPSGDDVKFSEFAQYVSEADTNTMNEHWQPLEHLCQPCAMDYDLVLHHETMERDAVELLAMAELSTRVPKFPYDKWDTVELSYVHKLYQDLSPALIGKLVKLYRADLGMFSYSSLV